MRRVTIVGMGALGLLYGAMIQDHAKDVELSYVMDDARAQKYQGTTFTINEKPYQFPMETADRAKEADLLIVAVKYTGLKSALDVMNNCIGERTIIVSVLNGISSEKIIAERFPKAHIIDTVAQGMDAMKFGNSLKYTQCGELHVGITGESQRKDLDVLVKFFEKVQIPYVIEADILYRMWGKFMLNVGINQTCMVYGQTYGEVLNKGESNRTLFAAFREVLAIANAEGIALSEKDVAQYVKILQTLDPKGTPSMGQDRINKKASEVDMFAGAVIELGKKHSISVPTNEFLYERAKEIEQEYV